MIFWDTSAIFPLLVQEPTSRGMRKLARSDRDIIAWWGTSLECLSAIARREREGSLSTDAAHQARGLLATVQASWYEVAATETVRRHAARLLLRHPLRAADALQLAAALVWVELAPDGQRFATLDTRLAHAARGEGFVLAV